MHIRWNAMVPGFSAVWLMLLFLSPAAIAQTTTVAESPERPESLIVETAAGAVKIRQADAWQSPRAGMSVALPAVVSTGADGSIRLRQSETVISVAADSAVELYEGATGKTLQRVVQNRGSAFYDIAPRGDNRLRVETPYLVAVIKGTEFDVTVTPESSTVALFEGRLQIEAPDVGDVVDLHEGHIARRHRDDARITVVRMEDGEPVARSPSPQSSFQGSHGDGGDDGIGALPDGTPRDPVAGTDTDVVTGGGLANTGTDVQPGIDGGDLDLAIDGGSTPGLGAEVPLDDGGIAAVGADVELGGGALDLGADVTADLGAASIDAGLDVGVDLGSGELDLAADLGAALGEASVDVGLDAGIDLGAGDLDIGADIAADLGDITADVGLDAGVDLGSGDVDLGADLGADLGDASVDAGLDAGVDLGGDVDLGADVGADLGDVAVDAGLDAGVDLGGGDVDLGASVGTDLGGAGVDVGLDAGADLAGGNLGADLDAGVDLGNDSVDVGADVDLGGGEAQVGASAGGIDLGLNVDLGGGLGSLIDVELDLDPSDDTESEDDDADDAPRLDLRDLLGL